MRAPYRVLGVLFAVPVLLAARVALGAPAQIHTVFWQQDTSIRASVDAFFACLTEQSTFGTSWSQEFGINSVTYAGSSVLTSAAPAQVTLGGNLDQLMSAAFASGALPAPQAGVEEEYLVYWPPTITAGDDMGETLCSAAGPCAEHHPFAQYQGITYDLALVPISCDMCAMGLDAATIGGEHEAAEGIADLAGIQYEVGDGCEMTRESIACCGQTYTIQQLAGTNGPDACQMIDSVGGSCVMPPEDGGGTSAPEAGGGGGGEDAGTAPDAGGGRGGSGGGGGSGVDAGSPASNDASGSTTADAGVAPSSGDDAGGAQDVFGGGTSGSGCGCVLAGGPSDESAQAIVVIMGLLFAMLRWRRRMDP